MFTIADVGLPMLVLQVPAAAILLLPIVVIEAVVFARVTHRSFDAVLKTVFLANLFSSFVGLPVAWVAMLLVEMATGLSLDWDVGSLRGWKWVVALATHSAWIPGDEAWMIPAAFLVLIVPYFFVSVLTERWVIGRTLVDVPLADLRRGAWWANLASYALLALWAGIDLYLTVKTYVGP